MFKTALGVTIPFPERIKEEFQVFDNHILLNLSFEKIELMVDDFLARLSEPLFFVFEIPLTQQEEAKIRKSDACPFHKKVCYLDGQSKMQIKEILQQYGSLLLNDGMSQFAIASHITNDEIFIQKYKIISIFCKETEKYIDFLIQYSLAQTDNIITVWDTFSRETPGETRKIELNNMDIYDVYDKLT